MASGDEHIGPPQDGEEAGNSPDRQQPAESPLLHDEHIAAIVRQELSKALKPRKLPLLNDKYFWNRRIVRDDIAKFADEGLDCEPQELQMVIEDLTLIGARPRISAGYPLSGEKYLLKAGKAFGCTETVAEIEKMIAREKSDAAKKKPVKGRPAWVDQFYAEILRRLKIVAGYEAASPRSNGKKKKENYDEWEDESAFLQEVERRLQRAKGKNTVRTDKAQAEPIGPSDAKQSPQTTETKAEEKSAAAAPEKVQQTPVNGALIPSGKRESAENAGFVFGSEYYTNQRAVQAILAYLSRVTGIHPEDLLVGDVERVELPMGGGNSSSGEAYLDQGVGRFPDIERLVESVRADDYRDPSGDEDTYFTEDSLRRHARQLVLDRLIDLAFEEQAEQSNAQEKPSSSQTQPKDTVAQGGLSMTPVSHSNAQGASPADADVKKAEEKQAETLSDKEKNEKKDIVKDEKNDNGKIDSKKQEKKVPAPKGVWSIGRPSIKGEEHLESLLRTFPEGTAGRKRILSLMRLRGHDPLTPAPATAEKTEPKKEEPKADAKKGEESKTDSKKAA